jgi:hypothetical protein
MESLNIGVSAWIIQDGNYDDFNAGQECRFALEFYPHSLTNSLDTSKSATHLKASLYQVCGQVIYETEQVWVVDFGFLAYQEAEPPKHVLKGGWVEGKIYVGIDPFFYFEGLNKLPGMPDLTYSFRIDQILLETTPWITSKDESGGTVMSRDQHQESYKEVSATDAWNDDDGNGHYVFKCSFTPSRVKGGNPTRTLRENDWRS